MATAHDALYECSVAVGGALVGNPLLCDALLESYVRAYVVHRFAENGACVMFRL